ncbi:MAG: RlmE family RNA methyltransferase [Candidatus Heimdallarchaeota archaeon]|nr:RlmE family RNA methyltransferase [Candidatus Heimdallarchaeota archaeon]MCK4253148.1 RlmE family RNA methyltransferase [Candidatus Heimdallarchaeota archaeon]
MKEDFYYQKARSMGYRSRASFKLLQINNKFSVFRKSQIIIDLGASPGGWSQVASHLVGGNGKVIAIDKSYITPFREKNIEILNKDILNRNLPTIILEAYGKIDGLISDCSPNISGDFSRDHSIQISLARRALALTQYLLKDEGFFICKLFQGTELHEFIEEMKRHFKTTKLYKPAASRKKSAEIYVVGLKYTASKGSSKEIEK